MNTHSESLENTDGPKASNGRAIWIGAAVFAACLALYVAEEHGFRIFDESLRSVDAGETIVPSPLEILTLLGTTSIGVCAGLVALISCVTWITRFMRDVRHAYRASDANYADDTAHCGAQQIAS